MAPRGKTGKGRGRKSVLSGRKTRSSSRVRLTDPQTSQDYQPVDDVDQQIHENVESQLVAARETNEIDTLHSGSSSGLSSSELDKLTAEITRQVLSSLRETEIPNEEQERNDVPPLYFNSRVDSSAEPNPDTHIMRGSDYSGLKILSETIPKFSGRNISVQTFARECLSALQHVDPKTRPFFVKLVRNRVEGEAELYLKNRHYRSLEELLESLEKAFGKSKTSFQIEAEIAQTR